MEPAGRAPFRPYETLVCVPEDVSLSEKEEEEYPPHYELAGGGLGRRLLPPVTDPEPRKNIPLHDSESERGMKNNPLVGVVMVVALLLVGLAFLFGILRW